MSDKKQSFHQIRRNILGSIYGIPSYWVTNFWYEEKKTIVIEFEAEGVTHTRDFDLTHFQTWVQQNFTAFIYQYTVNKLDRFGEKYDSEIIWDAALQGVPRFIVEDFLNNNLNISLNQ